MRDGVYEIHDWEAIRILQDFLPDQVFDAHAHLYDSAFLRTAFPPDRQPVYYGLEDYRRDMLPIFGKNRTLDMNIITYPDKSMADPACPSLEEADTFLLSQLHKSSSNVGEIMVRPNETAEQLEKRLVHPRIRGFKCYHTLSSGAVTWDSEIGEYLPEAAWEVADQKGLCITLHMVKDKALSDPGNLRYITEMARKYPNATLILAHAARAFAAWTGVEAVQHLAKLDNVWFDFSAVCESPAVFRILKTTGTERCMWGSDYPVCMLRGKAISLADSFYWINQNDLDRFSGSTTVPSWLVGMENLMAVRQACIMADLSREDIERVFCKNAMRCFLAADR